MINYPFCVLRLLVEKVWLLQKTMRMRERDYETLGTSIIYSTISPPSQILNTNISIFLSYQLTIWWHFFLEVCF